MGMDSKGGFGDYTLQSPENEGYGATQSVHSLMLHTVNNTGFAQH